MKELKFRAWNTEKKEMYFFKGIFNNAPFEETSTFPMYESCKIPIKVDVMQYTGLTDANGVEIYEGDILTNLGEVIWSERAARFCFRLPRKNPYGKTIQKIFSLWPAKDLEVVGNIYENADLLEGERP